MKFGCSSKYYKCRPSKPIGLACTRFDLVVSNWPLRFSWQHRPPFACGPGFILSWASPLLQSTSLLCTCQLSADNQHLPWGYQPSFATSVCGVHLATDFPHLFMFRPQCFSHSRRVTPPQTLWAYFIPLPRPRFTLQGFFSAASWPDSSPGSCPPVVSSVFLRLGCPNRARSCRFNFKALIQLLIRCH